MQKRDRVILAALVAGLLIGAAAAYALAAASPGRTITTTTTLPAVTITSTTTVTASATSTIQSVTGSTGLVTLYRTNGDWNFSLTLNATTVKRGQVIAALLNLTNISGQNQSVHIVDPLYAPIVYAQNGTEVSCVCPSEINSLANWIAGPVNSQKWDIPTSSLPPGESYVLNVWPLVGPPTLDSVDEQPYLIGESLMINATFTVD
jgi:hypothetical protein